MWRIWPTYLSYKDLSAKTLKTRLFETGSDRIGGKQRATVPFGGGPLSCQLLDRKENAEHGLLTIEVELVGADEAAFCAFA